MTPKEKAQQLFDLMFKEIDNKGMYDDLYRAKQCALIAVDEILHNFGLTANGQTFYTEYRAVQHYQEVKQEIENL